MAGYLPPNYNYGQQPPPPSQNKPYADAKAPTHGTPPSGYGAPSSAPYNPSAPGHPPPSSGYPQGGASGYPSAPSGYPQGGASGYPSAPSGYPQGGASGYPSAPSGYPQGGASGYPSAPSGYSSSGYPPAPSGYSQPPSGYSQPGQGYPPPPGSGFGNNPFGSLVPSVFPPGTDPNVVTCFKMADQDGSGFIDDVELQRALSSYNEKFSIRTVHLLMYLFTNSNARKIGPKEFTAVFQSLQNWRGIFERFDRDRSGKIDHTELRDALMSLGFSVSPVVLDLLVSKFDKSGGRNRAIEYDNFIECCLTVKGLTEKFQEKDTNYSGSATFNYESFMLTVLPFLIA